MFQIQTIKKYDTHIVGYYGMQNSGDDALMHATLWGANNLLNYKSNSMGAYQAINNVPAINKQVTLRSDQVFPGQNRLTQYKAAAQSKSIIFGGGSVLHSETDINFKRHMMKLAGNHTSRAVGVSLGPFQSVAAERSCANFLQECSFVGVRDQQSLDIARELAPDANVEKTFDLAPLLLCAKPIQKINKTRSGIALSLCPVAVDPFGNTNTETEKKRINEICHLIEKLYVATGESITLLTFNGHSLLGDWKINQSVVARLSNKLPITMKMYNPNPFDVLNDLTNYKVIISMRLHGSILGYLANTPVISINYHSKCKGWCQQIGLNEQYQFDADNLHIDAITQQIEQGFTDNFVSPTLAISSALTNALSNWSITHDQAKFYSNYSAI